MASEAIITRESLQTCENELQASRMMNTASNKATQDLPGSPPIYYSMTARDRHDGNHAMHSNSIEPWEVNPRTGSNIWGVVGSVHTFLSALGQPTQGYRHCTLASLAAMWQPTLPGAPQPGSFLAQLQGGGQRNPRYSNSRPFISNPHAGGVRPSLPGSAPPGGGGPLGGGFPGRGPPGGGPSRRRLSSGRKRWMVFSKQWFSRQNAAQRRTPRWQPLRWSSLLTFLTTIWPTARWKP